MGTNYEARTNDQVVEIGFSKRHLWHLHLYKLYNCIPKFESLQWMELQNAHKKIIMASKGNKPIMWQKQKLQIKIFFIHNQVYPWTQ